jgi:hypothetical protein
MITGIGLLDIKNSGVLKGVSEDTRDRRTH